MNINESKTADQQQMATNIIPPDNSQFPLEFWTNFLARNQAATNTPQNVAIAAATAAFFQPQQQINTNIRLPPPFNLTATIQHLLSRTMPQQNPALLLQQALLGGHQIGLNPGGEGERNRGETFDGGLDGLKKEEEGEQPDLAANFAEEIGIGVEGNTINIKNEPNDGINDMNESPILANPFPEEVDEEVNNNDGTSRPQQPQQQRRPRVGGSSAKTAEVWRFFTQSPDGEQAATCSICQKKIKATNSSTTGMIRHLRSCHHEQFVELQKARLLKTLKNVSADSPMREEYLRQFGIPIEGSFEAIKELEKFLSALQNPSDILPTMVAPKHSVESLINPENRDNNGLQILPQVDAAQLPMEQRQFFEQIENFKTMNRPTSIERQQKKKEIIGTAGVDGGGGGQGHPNAGKRTIMEKQQGGEEGNGPAGNDGIIQQQNIDHFREPKRRKEELAEPGMAPEKMGNAAGTTPKGGTNGGKRSRKSMATTMLPPNLHPKMNDENGKESTRISEQMAAMFLVDNTEFLLDRIAFRQFIHSIIPNYQMPSKEQFRNEIIPRVARQFEQMAHFRGEMQRNNPFGLPFVVAHQTGMAAAIDHSMNMLNSSCSSSSSSSNSASISSSASIAQSATSPVLSTPSISNNSVISPLSSAEESGFHDEESSTIGDNGGQHQHTHLKLKDAEELAQLAQMATNLFQNIPRSFIAATDNNEG